MFSLGHETGVYQHESKQVHHWIPGATKDGDGAEIHSKTLLPTTSQTVSFGIPNYIDTTDTKNGYGYGIIAIENPGSMAAARSRGAVRILSVVDPSVVIKN